MTTLTYPETSYCPPPLPDIGSKAERERLSSPALKSFFKLMRRWQVRDEDARRLLGGVSNGPYYQMKKNPVGRILDADDLLRVSYLLGIFKALNTLHGARLADQWPNLPNSNRIFHGLSPLDYMKKGGVPAMQNVGRLLDSRVQGA
jgi:hypothetical protein